jgi:alpha-beta hydrolase superfamily lysophospholipase
MQWAMRFLEPLQERFPFIYGPDLRGFGFNREQPTARPARQMLADLQDFIHQEVLPQGHRSVTLAGISLGGVLASLLAQPGNVRLPFQKLILIAPAFRPHPSSFSLGYVGKTLFNLLLHGPRFETTLPYDLKALTRNPSLLADDAHPHAEPMRVNGQFLWEIRSLNQEAFRRVRQLTVPTLMVVPGRDTVCDPTAMTAAFNTLPKDIPKVLRTYPEALHDLLMEVEVEDLADFVARWTREPLPEGATLTADSHALGKIGVSP